MKKISSENNGVYKTLKKLAFKKYRDRLGLYAVEGENLVKEALCHGIKIKNLIFCEGSEQKWKFQKDSFDLLRKHELEFDSENFPSNDLTENEKLIISEKESPEPVIFSEKLFTNVASTVTSQGVIAIVEKREWRDDSLRYFFNKPGNLLIMDRLQDPGNIGAIIRTAEAAGYSAVICLKGTSDVYSPKAVRSAAGSLFRMPVLNIDDVLMLTSLVKKSTKKLIVSDMEGTPYNEANLANEVALVIGNEGRGCSDYLKKSSDLMVRIPMRGHLESLNASVAAAILMYEAVR